MSNNKKKIYEQERAHLLLQLVQWSYDATKKHEDKISEIKRIMNREERLGLPLLSPEDKDYYKAYLDGCHKLEGNDRGTIMEMEYGAWDGVCDPPNDPIPNPADPLDSILSGYTRVGFFNDWSSDEVMTPEGCEVCKSLFIAYCESETKKSTLK